MSSISPRSSSESPSRSSASPVDWVDPTIGTVAVLLEPTSAIVQRPHGAVRLAPNRQPGPCDPALADKIVDFPFTLASHRGARVFAVAVLSGPLSIRPEDYASESDADGDRSTPYVYRTRLEDHEIDVATTATGHSAVFQFRFSRPGPSHILIRVPRVGSLETVSDCEVRGREVVEGVPFYFHARLDRACTECGGWSAGDVELRADVRAIEGESIGVALTFADLPAGGTIEVRVGLSCVGPDQARENLERETSNQSFEILCGEGRRVWNETLGRIEVEGGSDRERRVFYTALYRAHERMIQFSEYGKYFSAWDGKVHSDEGAPFYVDDWIWDTHRTLHPLQLILDPERQRHMLESYARMIAQGKGWAPTFPLFSGDKPAMLGNHAAAVAADAWMKGLRGFDVETLYRGIRKNAVEGSRIPWHRGPATELDRVYLEKGFFPALAPGEAEWVKEVTPGELRQSVSVTLEHAYDDWCIAELAAALGKRDDRDRFLPRAANYRNCFNPTTGFMAPRTADGRWVEPFDPSLSGGQGGRHYFAECNSWTWTWSVPHDVAGLIRLMGGRDGFLRKLDRLFNQPLGTGKFHFLSQFPDATGLVGQFPMGNEPGFLIPYLYLYAGAPWRTQRRLRQLMELWFFDHPLGICGDEDGGALSSWYVFGAMGFYPLCPGRPVYGIGSPVFAKTTIHMGADEKASGIRGGTFTIVAEGVSRRNKYVQSATLNGRPLNRAWFTHADLIDGGCLSLEMGPTPNKSWAADPAATPPSLSD